ncbi:src homology 2 domain-containing transforming protein C2 (predicted), isoform CRA_b [Rattus norvegicus]|uniref:Src homology 2 domain-containing transforming protein C2 (Predicted), isoform CRA_b n=1 Tax=Rattus norvegicus TaxID=10116 RepID=A6K8Z7_RAT|nr:src homology 2 domain-containing transforming protein C2 (predicted), isoform CRA_b [Rattus norvegicus]
MGAKASSCSKHETPLKSELQVTLMPSSSEHRKAQSPIPMIPTAHPSIPRGNLHGFFGKSVVSGGVLAGQTHKGVFS